jgi:hypothetical protein
VTYYKFDGLPGSYELFEGPDYNMPPGWYWWSCWPGCLPDGEATGPFDSCEAAMVDAMCVCEQRD